MFTVKYAAKCVTRATRAVSHALWLNFEETGYILATGELPDASDLTDPELAEYERTHDG